MEAAFWGITMLCSAFCGILFFILLIYYAITKNKKDVTTNNFNLDRQNEIK